ncbi:MAG: crotonase/enoyl-CoA hydratase family protein [Oleiphilaceae bacterium]|nr:crotonase/enoyl-CoA hydratase family protein [Oleiphilaceae bacterium]
MSELLGVNIEDGIATLTLNNGKVNAFSHEMIAAVNAGLDEAEAAGAVVIITGQPGIFSGGYDLKTMQASPEAAMALVKEGSTLTRRILSFPQPVVAACNGHAIAKGVFVLLCCDHRIGVSGDFKLGLNEVAIGIPMHHAGIAMARHRMPKPFFNRSVITAEMFDPDTAIAAGILDRVVPPEALMATARKVAEAMKGLNRDAYLKTKLKVRKDYLEHLDWAIEEDARVGFS